MPQNAATRKAVALAKYGTCDYWHALDTFYDTTPGSPLHHDTRCNDCRVSCPTCGLPTMPGDRCWRGHLVPA